MDEQGHGAESVASAGEQVDGSRAPTPPVNAAGDLAGPSLFDSPFHVLGVSPRDGRRRIVAAAAERALLPGGERAAEARSILTNPRARLGVELAWLPGISPGRSEHLIASLASDAVGMFAATGLPPLAHANLASAALSSVDEQSSDEQLTQVILSLASIVDDIDVDAVLNDIDADRQVAGFPPVQARSPIEEGLAERRREWCAAIMGLLDRLPPKRLAVVASMVLDAATTNGRRHAPLLIDEVADAYAIATLSFLVREGEGVRQLLQQIRSLAQIGGARLASAIERLEQVVANWCLVARPVQIAMASRGLAHPGSIELGHAVRDLGVSVWNDHEMLAPSGRIIDLARQEFSVVRSVADRADEDAKALEAIGARRAAEELLRPVYDACTAATEAIEADPGAGETAAGRVLTTVERVLGGKTRPELDATRVHDVAAGVVSSCAIAFGNATEHWARVVWLLEEAERLAREPELRTRIAANLTIARSNIRLLSGTKPVQSAPPLYTINGCGLTIYGRSDPDAESGSYVATYYFVLLFLPILPLRRYRVIPIDRGYRFMRKVPLRRFDKLHLSIVAAAVAWFVVTRS